MIDSSRNKWQSIVDLISELKRCDEHDLTTASIALAFVCMDALANLAMPVGKQRVTRKDFKDWVDQYLQAHPDQPYQYRSIDVYAARCAFLHTYGAEAALHEENPDIIKFVYSNGGKHFYNRIVDPTLAIIGSKSFINDVIIGVDQFLEECQRDQALKQRVESRLNDVFQHRHVQNDEVYT